MKFIPRYIISVLVIVCVVCLCQGRPNGMAKGHDKDNTNAGPKDIGSTNYGTMKKLKAFHYIKQYRGISPSKTPGNPPSLEESLMELQRMGGLQETGEIDEPTARLMTWPRCGLPNTVQVHITEEGERKRRYIKAGPSFKWNKMDLTYKFKNYPNRSISVITDEDAHDAVRIALKLWSDVTPLNFTRITDDSPADIVLLFGKKVHTSVKGDPAFDGPGGTLAHAFTPNSGWGILNGDVHYDDDESFTHKKYFGRNLQYITAHEVGHALGLDHSDVSGALMWPWIFGYTPNYQLPEDDRHGIQNIYGENPNPPTDHLTTTAAPTTPGPPAGPYCNITFDDVAIIRGEIFAFKGKVFWRFSLDGHLVNNEDGSPIRGFFKGVPSTVSGIYERWFDEKVIFVKGKNYWELDGVKAEEGYPMSLSELGVPRGIDGVMHRASTGVTYFFKAKLAYEYDEYERTLISETPHKIHHIFSGIPRGTTLTGSFTGTDGYGYLITGNYYFIVNPKLESDGVLRNFAQDFLRCPQ